MNFSRFFLRLALFTIVFFPVSQSAMAENPHATHVITMNDFFHNLPDGDLIVIGVKDTGEQSKSPTIRFATATGVRWWKAISLSGKSGARESRILCQDANNKLQRQKISYCEYQLQPDDLDNNHLVLSKAVQSGDHMNIYQINGIKEVLREGHIYTFLWAMD